MDQPLALEPIANARFDHQIGRALLKYAGAHAIFDVLSTAPFGQNRLNHALPIEQMREQQSRRSRSADSDLCSQTQPILPGELPILHSACNGERSI